MAGVQAFAGNHLPLDKFHLAYIFLLIHGIGFLIPWNVFINAGDYYVNYKLNTTTSYDADYRSNFMSYIGFAAHFPSLCFSAWNTFYQSGTKSSNPVVRFVVAMVVELLVLFFTIILSLIDTSEFPGLFFGMTIASVVLINSCVGIHQTLTFGMAAVLPMKYSNAVIVGSNACGTIISIVNILTKWLASVEGGTPKSIVVAAVAYFLSAVAILIACLVTFFWLRRLPFVQYYSSRANHRFMEVPATPVFEGDNGTLMVEPPIGTNPLPNGDRLHNDSAASLVEQRSFSPANLPSEASGDRLETDALLRFSGSSDSNTVLKNGFSILRNCCGLCCFRSPVGKQRCRSYWARYATCFSKCWVHCLSVWCVFFCSLSVFPAIQSMVKPSNSNYFISSTWFKDVTCFLFFNLFSMLGCIVCNWIHFPGPRYLWILVWIRCLFFIPFFLFSNFGFPEPKLPVLISNDHLYVLGAVIFSFTNGYFPSLIMMYAPRSCPSELAEVAGMLTSFFLTLGVCSGVYASRGFMSLII